MPDEGTCTAKTTEKIDGIPLYLIPKTIAEQIKKKGDGVFQILVVRKFHHRYSVNVETFDEHAARVNQAKPAKNEGDGHV
jgi:hypothetical protein